jgi:hypothetical protein
MPSGKWWRSGGTTSIYAFIHRITSFGAVVDLHDVRFIVGSKLGGVNITCVKK